MSEQITRRDFIKIARVAFGGLMLLGVPEIEYDARESTTVLSSTLLNGSGMVVVIDNATQNARVLTGKLVTTTDNETGEQIIGLENSFESSVATAATYFYTAEEMARSRANGYELESATAIPFPVSNDTGLIGKNVKTREEAESVMEKIQILINDHQEGAAAVEGKLIIYKYVGSKGVAYSTEILIGSGFDGPEVSKMEFTRLEPLPGNESKIVDSSTPTVRIRARKNGSINTGAELPAEVVEKDSELNKMGIPEGAKLGKDENGKPIYFVTNPAGEQVTVGQKNETGEWEPALSVRFNLFESFDAAIASGQVIDGVDVLSGEVNNIGMLKGTPSPENVLTGLDVIIAEPNVINKYYDELKFDPDGAYLIKKNPDRAPYKEMGRFVFKGDLDGAESLFYGIVWQWTRKDGSHVYINTVASSIPSDRLEVTPFTKTNIKPNGRSKFFDSIAGDIEIHKKIDEWAENNDVPLELQGYALIMNTIFK